MEKCHSLSNLRKRQVRQKINLLFKQHPIQTTHRISSPVLYGSHATMQDFFRRTATKQALVKNQETQ